MLMSLQERRPKLHRHLGFLDGLLHGWRMNVQPRQEGLAPLVHGPLGHLTLRAEERHDSKERMVSGYELLGEGKEIS